MTLRTLAGLGIALLAGAILAVLARSGAGTETPHRVAYTSRTMGTLATVLLVTPDSVASAPDAEAARKTFARIDSLMSNWTETSEVARINREAGSGPVTVNEEVSRVLEIARRVGVESDSCFDITVEPMVRLWGFLGGPPRVPDPDAIAALLPRIGWDRVAFDPETRSLRLLDPDTRIDLGGVAKGYGVDAVTAVLRARGVRDALVDLSGNMMALGSPPDRPHWTIGIRDPRDRLPYVARLSLSGAAVATSGAYEQFVARDGRRYGHILDPRTGWPVDDLLAVTVVAPTATEADAWSTACFVLGRTAAMTKARAHPELDGIFIVPGEERDTLLVESSLAERVVLEEAARDMIVLRTF
jgi:thiamine biosynthesis lipoprotein